MRQRITIDWAHVLTSSSPASPTAGRSAAPGSGQVEYDRGEMFDNSSPSSAYCDDVCFASPPSPPRAAAEVPGSLLPAKRVRSGDPARAPSDDSDGDSQRRLQARRGGLGRRVGERARVEERAIRPVAKAAAAAVTNVVDLDGEDECGDENVTLENRLKSFPLLDRKKNHGQADNVGECVAPPTAKKNEKEAARPEEIFEALIAIPGLAREDLLRAYSMLIRDDRQFWSLVALPKDMRKDWMLMEIGKPAVNLG